MFSKMIRSAFVVVVALACAACGSSGGSDESFVVACSPGQADATHDFGTTDPTTLARVVAFRGDRDEQVVFVGSVGSVSCECTDECSHEDGPCTNGCPSVVYVLE